MTIENDKEREEIMKQVNQWNIDELKELASDLECFIMTLEEEEEKLESEE